MKNKPRKNYDPHAEGCAAGRADNAREKKRSAGSLGFVDTPAGRRELILTTGGVVTAPVDNAIDLGTGRRIGRFLARRLAEIPRGLMRQLEAAQDREELISKPYRVLLWNGREVEAWASGVQNNFATLSASFGGNWGFLGKWSWSALERARLENTPLRQ